ncbi:MAG TPA: helix-turn-helix domain-containing protein [Steroidobacteraceae bacterium]
MARKYGLKCPVAKTLDVIGDRWSVMLLREFFMHGNRRFQDFEQAFAGLTPSVLSVRLKELEASGIVHSRLYSTHPPRLEYFLTPRGSALGPMLKEMKRWGEMYG